MWYSLTEILVFCWCDTLYPWQSVYNIIFYTFSPSLFKSFFIHSNFMIFELFSKCCWNIHTQNILHKNLLLHYYFTFIHTCMCARNSAQIITKPLYICMHFLDFINLIFSYVDLFLMVDLLNKIWRWRNRFFIAYATILLQKSYRFSDGIHFDLNKISIISFFSFGLINSFIFIQLIRFSSRIIWTWLEYLLGKKIVKR